jgi:hypothetical protein
MFGAMTARTTKDKTYEERHRIEERTTPKAPKAKTKTKSEPAAKASEDGEAAKEPADRLPSTVDELKAGKAGLATYLFLSGKGKEEIAAS